MVTDQDETIRLTHGSMMQMVNRVGLSLSTYNHATLTEEPKSGIKKGQGIKLPADPKKKRAEIVKMIKKDAKEQPLIVTVKTYSDGAMTLKGTRRPPKPKEPKEKEEKADAEPEAEAEVPAEE